MEQSNVSRERKRLLISVSVLAVLRLWLMPVEANRSSDREARNWLLTCHLSLAKL